MPRVDTQFDGTYYIANLSRQEMMALKRAIGSAQLPDSRELHDLSVILSKI